MFFFSDFQSSFKNHISCGQWGGVGQVWTQQPLTGCSTSHCTAATSNLVCVYKCCTFMRHFMLREYTQPVIFPLFTTSHTWVIFMMMMMCILLLWCNVRTIILLVYVVYFCGMSKEVNNTWLAVLPCVTVGCVRLNYCESGMCEAELLWHWDVWGWIIVSGMCEAELFFSPLPGMCNYCENDWNV